MTTLATLEQAIGQQMRRLREGAAVRQETIASGAAMWALPWTQATVAAIELGQRGLMLGEFIMLPLVFLEVGIHRADGTPLQLEDFVPQSDEEGMPNVPVVPGGLQLPLRIVRTLLRGGHPPAGELPTRRPAGPGVAERKMARKLGCSTTAVMNLAQELWQRTLSEERDARIGARAAQLDRRSLQAVRGRVTRALVSELKRIIIRRRRRK